jgi:hypothetical protein
MVVDQQDSRGSWTHDNLLPKSGRDFVRVDRSGLAANLRLEKKSKSIKAEVLLHLSLNLSGRFGPSATLLVDGPNYCGDPCLVNATDQEN